MGKDIVVRKSKIAGKGVFAARDFAKGETVISWKPKSLTKKELAGLPESEKHYIDRYNNRYFHMQPPERYVNHSCDANTKTINLSDVAVRDIRAGEEITSDYGDDNILPFKCQCGSKHCRGKIL